jgi:hypothetical protein
MSPEPTDRHVRLWRGLTRTTVAFTVATAGCAGAGSGTSGSATASDAEWRALSAPRPTPLAGAARVAVADVEFLGAYPWRGPGTVTASLGVAELVVTGLLRRRDVQFVERRRFAAAAEAERRGVTRPRGAPAAGVSPSADYATTAVWIPLGSDQTAVEVRLAGLETGRIAGATRVTVPSDVDPVTLARAIVQGVVDVLEEIDQLPNWTDPTSDGQAIAPVSEEALSHFLRGLAAEEIWDWEGARRGYQAAAADRSFHEAATALARTARLRLGGTLAES